MVLGSAKELQISWTKCCQWRNQKTMISNVGAFGRTELGKDKRQGLSGPMPLQKGGDVVIPESAKKLAQDSGRGFSKLLAFKKKDDAWCFREDETLNKRHARPLELLSIRKGGDMVMLEEFKRAG